MDDQNAIMFRPGLAVLQKSLQLNSSTNWIMLRLFQITLTTLFLWLFYKICREKNINQLAIVCALFYVISNPFLYAPYVVYGYAGALLLLPLFCITVMAIQKPHYSHPLAICGVIMCIVGPFIQEFGLLFLPLWGYYFYKHKKFVYCLYPILAICLYAFFRHHVLGNATQELPFTHGTGLGTKLVDPETLNSLFKGPKVYLMYLYTLLAQTGNLLFSQPNYGYFSLTPFPALKLYRLILFGTSTSLIIIALKNHWKTDKPFILIALSLIAMNIPLSFSYARPRILVIASVGYALLLAWSLHKTSGSQKSTSFAIVLCLGWALHSADNIGHVWHDKQQNENWYLTKKEPLRGPQSIYLEIQKKVINP